MAIAQIENTPILGGTAPREACRTAQKLAGFALSHVDFIQCMPQLERYLDVGCGNGFITEVVAPGFEEVVGIDVEEERLGEFREHVSDRPNFKVLSMSAAEMELPSEFFSLITCFEVLEHVADLEATVRGIKRVCKPGGIVAISVPQVWFPFENHGARVGDRVYSSKIPLLPYLRPLHRKYSLARVFSSAEMDELFLSKEMELLRTSYSSPQFERAAARETSWESKFAFLRNVLDRCEKIPVLRALTGVSMLKAYRKRQLPV
jgi:ubiquinone/menaquinone biosynthesis C-methylase UbiE